MKYRDMTPEQKAKHDECMKKWRKKYREASGITLNQQYQRNPPRLDDEPDVAYDVADIPSCLRGTR